MTITLKQLVDALVQARDTIAKVEWTNAVDGGIVCPWCGNRKYDGHWSRCPRETTLAVLTPLVTINKEVSK